MNYFDNYNKKTTGTECGNGSSLISLVELANRLKVPKSWVYSRTRVTEADSIPCIRVGKYIRFEWDKVKAWLERKNEFSKGDN